MIALLLLLLSATAWSDDAFRGAGVDERIGDRVPDDLAFIDESGHPHRLGDLRGSTPLLLVPAYYRCPMLCGLVLDGVAKGVQELRWAPGERFHLAAFSFDPADDPASARERQKTAIGGRWPAERWPFLTADRATIDRTLGTLGVRVARDGEQFAHAAVAVVLTPDGRIARYLYGIDFPARDLRLALLEAADGRTRSTLERALLFCYHYDAASHRYGFAVTNALRAGSILAAVIATVAIALLARRMRRRALA